MLPELLRVLSVDNFTLSEHQKLPHINRYLRAGPHPVISKATGCRNMMFLLASQEFPEGHSKSTTETVIGPATQIN